MFDVPGDLIHRVYEDEEARRADFSPEVLEIIDELGKYTQELTREDKDYIYEKNPNLQKWDKLTSLCL